jgi:hypothetical protein
LTQGSQSLALGLTLAAAPQLVEDSRLISSGCDQIDMTCGSAARCAEKLRFSGSWILDCGGYAAVPDPLRERQQRRSREIILRACRKSGAFPHIEGQSPKKALDKSDANQPAALAK